MKPVQIDEFCRFKYLSEVTFSPSGKTACFTVTEADREGNRYRSCIYMKKGGHVRRLTSGGKERGFRYLDETTVLFPGNREESKELSLTSRFYSISLLGGEAELAFTFPIPVSKVVPLKGGDCIVVGTTFPGWEELYTGDKKLTAAYLKDQKDNADYEEIRQVPWWWNGATYTKGAYDSLFFYDHKTKKLTRLTEPDVSVSDAELQGERNELYFLTTPVKPRLELNGHTELWRLELPSRKLSLCCTCRPGFQLEGFLPGKSFLLLFAHDGRYGLNTDVDFYKYDYESGAVDLYAKHGESIGSSVGADVRYGGGRAARMDGDVCWFISTRFDDAFLYKLERGVITQITSRRGSVDCFDVHGEKLLLCALYDMKPQELYDETGKQITHFNDRALQNKYTAIPEELNCARDGYEIHGFVLKPIDFDPSKKYPVIYDIHGGPKTVYGPVYYHEMQYWAGLGYFVIYCNPTGSDGRNAFMDIRGKYGTVDYEDLMAFCDTALAAYPQMDKYNLFETGGSYGGFMTNWIIGHTDRFRACASQRSISNWFSFYGVSDIGVDFALDQNASDPWGDPEKLWAHSPMKYADRVKTPTLFIHSFEDYRCPIDQGYQMFTALIAHGVEAKMVCFRGENHELSRSGKPLHRIRRLKEITEWFEGHRVSAE